MLPVVASLKKVHRAFVCARNLHGSRRIVQKSVLTQRSGEVAQEVFLAPASKPLQILCYVGAATQLIFWGNLAQWAGTGYAVKDEYHPVFS